MGEHAHTLAHLSEEPDIARQNRAFHFTAGDRIGYLRIGQQRDGLHRIGDAVR